LISFHWISFYNICRGYGISMAFLLTSFLCLHEYVKNNSRIWLYGFLLAVQIAISANLTLILITLIVTILLIVYQFLNRKLFDWKILLGYSVHVCGLYFWINFSFFLQEKDAL